MLFFREFTVCKHERGLLFENGDFVSFLAPGVHRFFDPRKRIDVERCDLSHAKFEHRLADFLVRKYPLELDGLFVRVETGANQVAVIYRNRRPWTVLGPQSRALYWKGVIDVTAEIIDIGEQLAVPPRIASAVSRDPAARRGSALDDTVLVREVPEAHVGLLYVDGRLVDELAPGVHAFWKLDRSLMVELVDLRVRTLAVGGQALLTKDRIELDIDLSATYRFANARQAVTAVKNPLDFLHREIQLGLRAAVSARTFDALLENRNAIEAEVLGRVRSALGAHGIEVRDIGITDLVLPDSRQTLESPGTMSPFSIYYT